jgi:C1A family cysteine protease
MFGAAHLSMNQPEVTADVAFEQWLMSQNKAYPSPAEKNYRKSIFAANLQKIEQDNKIYSYLSATNQFSDLTEEEFISKYTGFRANSERTEEYLPETNQDEVDWVKKGGVVNPMKNQANCGSCWAFSAVSAVESVVAIKTQKLLDLAEQQLVDCGIETGNHGCSGGWMDYAFKYIQNRGIMATKDYPYTARDGKCQYDATKVAARITGFTDVPASNCAQLLTAIAKNPTSVAVAANAMMSYKSGVFDNPNCGTGLNHGITAEGYGKDAASGKDFYLVRNSWGTSWGEAGYIRMSRSVQTSTGICGICMVASYPTA